MRYRIRTAYGVHNLFHFQKKPIIPSAGMWLYVLLIVSGLVGLHLAVLIYLRQRPKKSILGKHVVVTGGSEGIGLWAAIRAAQLGADVTIVARKLQLLEKAQLLISEHRLNPTQRIHIKSLDLSSDYENVAKKFAEIENASGPIYMLVNCAGFAVSKTVEDTSAEEARRLMDVNYFGTFYPVKYVVGKMREAGHGIIVITSSQAGLLGVYGFGAYGASKFALRGLAETLAIELSHTDVSVTLSLPADTDTPGYAVENETKPEITKIISGTASLAKPEDVGRQIIEDALKRCFFSVTGIESWLITIACSGLAPWGDVGLTLLCSVLMGPLKLVGAGIQWNFRKIVRDHYAAAKTKQS